MHYLHPLDKILPHIFILPSRGGSGKSGMMQQKKVNGSQLLENSFSLLDPIENDHFHGITTKQHQTQRSKILLKLIR